MQTKLLPQLQLLRWISCTPDPPVRKERGSVIIRMMKKMMTMMMRARDEKSEGRIGYKIHSSLYFPLVH